MSCATTCSPTPPAGSTTLIIRLPGGARDPDRLRRSGDGLAHRLVATQQGMILVWDGVTQSLLAHALPRPARRCRPGPMSRRRQRAGLARAGGRPGLRDDRPLLRLLHAQPGRRQRDVDAATSGRSVIRTSPIPPPRRRILRIDHSRPATTTAAICCSAPTASSTSRPATAAAAATAVRAPVAMASDRTRLLGKVLRIDVRGVDPRRPPDECGLDPKLHRALDQPVRRTRAGLQRGLGPRAAQSLPHELRPGDRRPLHRRRRTEQVGGDQPSERPATPAPVSTSAGSAARLARLRATTSRAALRRLPGRTRRRRASSRPGERLLGSDPLPSQRRLGSRSWAATAIVASSRAVDRGPVPLRRRLLRSDLGDHDARPGESGGDRRVLLARIGLGREPTASPRTTWVSSTSCSAARTHRCIHNGSDGCFWAGFRGLFEDDFESQGTSHWSSSVP